MNSTHADRAETETTEQLCDVIAVNTTSLCVRLISQGKSKANAMAVESMAVMRRGVDEEFFATVPAKTYADGDKYKGGAL